jgi:hypothetical protein
MNLGGYGGTARELNRRFAGRRISRQQVRAWALRGTHNQAGQPFPAPVYEQHTYDLDAVAGWYAAGVPLRQLGTGWYVPEARATPLTVW